MALRQIGAVPRRDLWAGWRDIKALCHGSSWRLEWCMEGAVATEVVLAKSWSMAATSGVGSRHLPPATPRPGEVSRSLREGSWE